MRWSHFQAGTAAVSPCFLLLVGSNLGEEVDCAVHSLFCASSQSQLLFLVLTPIFVDSEKDTGLWILCVFGRSN